MGRRERTSDTVPAMLTPGEIVVKKSVAQKLENRRKIRAMGQSLKPRGVRKYAAGGEVDEAEDAPLVRRLAAQGVATLATPNMKPVTSRPGKKKDESLMRESASETMSDDDSLSDTLRGRVAGYAHGGIVRGRRGGPMRAGYRRGGAVRNVRSC